MQSQKITIIAGIIIGLTLAGSAGFYFGFDNGWEGALKNSASIGNIGNELDKRDLIRIDSPRPNQRISSPLAITGQARGHWFFEATFPIMLIDANGKVIAQHYAQAKDEWMTEEFVPFEATLEFEPTAITGRATLILQKSNASGLPEHDDALEVPVLFE